MACRFGGDYSRPSVAIWGSSSSTPRRSIRRPMASWSAPFGTICRSSIANSRSGNVRRCDARYPMMQKRVTPEGCLGLFRRQVYLDVALRGKEVMCYETVEGLEVRRSKHRLYLLREYRRWQNRSWREELPEDLRFEPYTPPVCPWIAVA